MKVTLNEIDFHKKDKVVGPIYNEKTILQMQQTHKEKNCILMDSWVEDSYFCVEPLQNLKVQSCKLFNTKFMIASAQTRNTEIFLFIVVLVFKLLGHEVLFVNSKRQQKLLKSRLLFKKTAYFTGKLLQNYEQLECEISGYFGNT